MSNKNNILIISPLFNPEMNRINDIVDYEEFYTKHEILAVSKEELLSNSELVTLHVPLDKSTCGMIGKKELNLMKTNSILINNITSPIVALEVTTGP